MTTRTALRPLSLFLLGSLAAIPAFADDSVVREYTFDISEINEVEFHASVGSMRIVPIEGDEARIVLEIKNDGDGWFDHGRDVSEIELESRVSGGRLVLEQDEEDTETEWTVQLPALARTTIHMGVGEIEAELGATELSIELGMGDVDVNIPQASVGEIDLSVGVGDATLRGGNADYQRAFVSQDVEGHGDGMLDMNIEIGVGDIDVTLD